MNVTDRFEAKIYIRNCTVGWFINIGDVLFLKEEVTNKDEYPDNYYTIGFNVINETSGEKMFIDIPDLMELKGADETE